MRKNILVFPCGSEIALEIYRAVNNSTYFNLIGASSVDDHGKFVYENYIDNIPYITDSNFLSVMKKIIKEKQIDAIYPAMDAVIEILKTNEDFLSCKVISSPMQTTKICLSKSKTYEVLKNIITVPKIIKSDDNNISFPVFAKPDIGYGSRGAKKINTQEELEIQLSQYPSSIILEYLPGKEYTVDCFTDKNGELLFSSPRERCRIMNGISVNTKPVVDNAFEFTNIANIINSKITFRGAWFFQVKRNEKDELVLMEVASRLGGSSSLFRAKGVNFALMSLFDSFDIAVSVLENNYQVEMDRALDNKYKINISYNEVFVDFDDCLYLEKKYLNTQLIMFLYNCINRKIKITLLSKHDDTTLESLDKLLNKLRINNLFDRVIHILPNENKIDFIDNCSSIFIDDSFAERKIVAERLSIPVFSIDMIEVL